MDGVCGEECLEDTIGICPLFLVTTILQLKRGYCKDNGFPFEYDSFSLNVIPCSEHLIVTRFTATGKHYDIYWGWKNKYFFLKNK